METNPTSTAALSVTTTPGNPPVHRQVMLSTQQDQALEWLMNGGSVTDAAQFAGVRRQTVSRWLRDDPDFRAVYDSWREQVAGMAEGQLIGLTESAVNTIATAIRNRQNVKAAEFVLKHLAAINKQRQAGK